MERGGISECTKSKGTVSTVIKAEGWMAWEGTCNGYRHRFPSWQPWVSPGSTSLTSWVVNLSILLNLSQDQFSPLRNVN